MLAHVAAFELILHRIVWSVLLLAVIIAARGRLRVFATAFTQPKSLVTHGVAGVLLSINWLVFVWAVNVDRVIETSLGYFLVPFVSTALGYFFLHERLKPVQIAAMGLAFGGVLIQIVAYGAIPWVGLTLAFSFGLYGLMRKQSPLGSLTGLGVETVLLAPLAIGALLYLHHGGGGALGRADLTTHLLLAGTALVTTVPLLLFSTGARLIPLSSIGLMQFITPSCTLLLGVFLYHEPFPLGRFVSFLLIWIGIGIYLIDLGRNRARVTAQERPPGSI